MPVLARSNCAYASVMEWQRVLAIVVIVIVVINYRCFCGFRVSDCLLWSDRCRHNTEDCISGLSVLCRIVFLALLSK